MDLSDLILKGGAFREQITGALFENEQDSDSAVCAIGAAIRGAQDAGLLPANTP